VHPHRKQVVGGVLALSLVESERLLVRHPTFLRGLPRFLGVSSLSTICARMSMDSAMYVAFSSGLLEEVGTP
jgi:hypothetical protein